MQKDKIKSRYFWKGREFQRNQMHEWSFVMRAFVSRGLVSAKTGTMQIVMSAIRGIHKPCGLFPYKYIPKSYLFSKMVHKGGAKGLKNVQKSGHMVYEWPLKQSTLKWTGSYKITSEKEFLAEKFLK